MYHTGGSEAIRRRIFSEEDDTKYLGVYAASDFVDLASPATIRQTLRRLTQAGVLYPVLTGIYCYDPEGDYREGRKTPFPFYVAEALARNNHWKIVPKGVETKFLINLSNCYPNEHIYYSTGLTRTYTYGDVVLNFVHTTKSYVYNMHRNSAMVVTAIQEAPDEKAVEEIVETLRDGLHEEDRARFLWDRQYASARIRRYFDRICGII